MGFYELKLEVAEPNYLLLGLENSLGGGRICAFVSEGSTVITLHERPARPSFRKNPWPVRLYFDTKDAQVLCTSVVTRLQTDLLSSAHRMWSNRKGEYGIYTPDLGERREITVEEARELLEDGSNGKLLAFPGRMVADEVKNLEVEHLSGPLKEYILREQGDLSSLVATLIGAGDPVIDPIEHADNLRFYKIPPNSPSTASNILELIQ